MQTKPVRSLGADITQASLQQTLDKLDISQQVSQLSYAEKRLLIIISLTQQLSGVTNDWGRTLESPSNQIRIMNEQWQRLQRNVGNIFLQVVGKVLPYLNAVLMVLNEIAKIIAALFGFKLDDFDFFDESTIGGVEDFGEALDGAADSAKKLKQGLRGFDKLNVITTQSASGVGTTGDGVGGINPKLMDAFNKAFDDYNKKLSEVQMKATRIRDKIMEWLGFTKYVDEKTGEVKFKFEKITGGTILGALAVGGSIYKGINFIFKTLQKIGLLKFGSLGEFINLFKNSGTIAAVTKSFEGLAAALGISSGALLGIVGAIVAVAGALIYAYNTSEEFKNKVNDAVNNVITLFETLYKVAEPIIKPLADLVVGTFKEGWENAKIALDLLYTSIETTFTTIVDFVGGSAKVISDIINLDFNKAWEDLKTMLGNVLTDIENWKEKLSEKIENLKTKFKEKLDEMLKKLGELPEKFGYFIGEAIGKIIKAVQETDWKKIGNDIIDNLTWDMIFIPINIHQRIKNFPVTLFTEILNNVWKIDWGEIGKAIVDGIVGGMIAKPAALYNWAKGMVKGIKDALGIHSPAQLILDAKIGDYSMDAIMLGMERQMPKLEEQAKGIINSLNQGIKEASVENQFTYDIPQLNIDSYGLNASSISSNNNANRTSVNPTIIVQVGNKEIARQVITDLQDMAKDNGKPITIGG